LEYIALALLAIKQNHLVHDFIDYVTAQPTWPDFIQASRFHFLCLALVLGEICYAKNQIGSLSFHFYYNIAAIIITIGMLYNVHASLAYGEDQAIDDVIGVSGLAKCVA